MWVTAFTGKSSNAGHKVYWNPHPSFMPVCFALFLYATVSLSLSSFSLNVLHAGLPQMHCFKFIFLSTFIVICLPPACACIFSLFYHLHLYNLHLCSILIISVSCWGFFISYLNKDLSTMISIWGAWAVRDIKYPETRTLRWTAERRRGEYEKVKNCNKETWFFLVCITTQIKVAWVSTKTICTKVTLPHWLTK